MELFNQHLDRQILLNSMASQFANAPREQAQFLKNDNTTLPKGGGLSRGSGLSQNTSGLPDAGYSTRKPAVKAEIASVGNDVSAVSAKGSDEGSDEGKEDETTSATTKTMIPTGKTSHPGGVSSSLAPPTEKSEQKHDTTAPPTKELVGFASDILGFGDEFKNTRSRKALVFKPEDSSKPIQGWKSLRSAGLNSKKFGKTNTNGSNFEHTTKDGVKGRLYFVNTTAWNDIKKKHKITVE